MAIEQEAQDQLEALKGDEVGYRTNRLQLDALVDERGRRDAQLLFSGPQGRSPSRTGRAVLAQIGARQAKEEGVDVRLQGSRKVRPRESIYFATTLTGDLDVRPAGNLAPAGVPGPDDRVPGLLRLGPEPVVEDRLVIGLKIRERNLSGSTVSHTEIPRHGQQAGRPIPGERSEKRFPLGQQPSRLASRQTRAGKGKGLADQRANIVPAASGKPQRLRRYRLQPLPESGRIGVDLRWRRAQQPRVVFTAEIRSRF
jgi:hypothetical protein